LLKCLRNISKNQNSHQIFAKSEIFRVVNNIIKRVKFTNIEEEKILTFTCNMIEYLCLASKEICEMAIKQDYLSLAIELRNGNYPNYDQTIKTSIYNTLLSFANISKEYHPYLWEFKFPNYFLEILNILPLKSKALKSLAIWLENEDKETNRLEIFLVEKKR